MTQPSSGKQGKEHPFPMEGMLIRLLQFITDAATISIKPRLSKPTGSRISIGQSPDRYRPRRLDEVFLEIGQMIKGTYICGQSGAGKTSLILLLILALISNGMGFVVINMHGDLSKSILNYLASICQTPSDIARVSSRLVWLEIFHPYYVPGINLSAASSRNQAYIEASELQSIYKRILKDVVWGPRMEELFRNVLYTLSLTGRPLIQASRLLTDNDFRTAVVSTVSDPDLRFYWEQRFASFSERMKPVVTEPVANKLSVLTEGPLMRDIAAQSESLVNFRWLLDNRNWVIINLSKGLLSQHAKLFGSIFTSKFKSAAMSRADIKEEERVISPFFVDELQNFLGDNYEEILSESRKYKLALVMAHQNLAQLEPAMRASMFGNVGTMILFRLGHQDINQFAQEFNLESQGVVKQVLSTLSVGEAVRREEDGSFRKIQIHRLPQFAANDEVVEQLRQSSFDRYYRRRSEVDIQIALSRSVMPQPSIVIYDTPGQLDRSRRGSRLNDQGEKS